MARVVEDAEEDAVDFEARELNEDEVGAFCERLSE